MSNYQNSSGSTKSCPNASWTLSVRHQPPLWKPVAVFDHFHDKEIFPYICFEPPVAHLYAVSTCRVISSQRDHLPLHFPWKGNITLKLKLKFKVSSLCSPNWAQRSRWFFLKSENMTLKLFYGKKKEWKLLTASVFYLFNVVYFFWWAARIFYSLSSLLLSCEKWRFTAVLMVLERFEINIVKWSCIFSRYFCLVKTSEDLSKGLCKAECVFCLR